MRRSLIDDGFANRLLSAYRLLGVPASEFANAVVELTELPDLRVSELAEQLAAAPGWPARFALLDRALLRWAASGPAADPAVAWAWQQLDRSHGQASVGMLAGEIGWSRRHFAARFREQVGLGPKPTGRVLRFRQAVQVLRSRELRSIADVAALCGYADHSHLDREFRALAGCTPSALLAAELP